MAKNSVTITANDLIKSFEKESFHDILSIIQNARLRAYSAVNKELINMYLEYRRIC